MIELVIDARRKDLGGFEVGRVLPFHSRRMVGPFIFLDQMGPAEFAPGATAIDVRPHPHIGLSTLTYLFEGEIMHHDNLGYDQAIRPGEVNWMTSGSGIVHSERTAPELRAAGIPVRELVPELRAVVSGKHWVDLMPPGVDKGVALERLLVAQAGGAVDLRIECGE